MIRKKSNLNSLSTNAFGLSSAGLHEDTPAYLNTVTITTLTAFIFIGADGDSVTVNYSPAKETWATIKAALEAAIVANGYYLGAGSDYGVKVIPDGSDFDIEITGDIKVTSISGVSATSTLLTSENQVGAGF